MNIRSKYTLISILTFVIILLFLGLFIYQKIKINFFITLLPPEVKIGQLLMIAPESTKFDDKLLKLIKEYHIGNIKIFGKNYKTKEELLELIIKSQNNAIIYNKGIPMLIATDQEGGWVAHLKENFTIPPSNMAIGLSKNKIYAYIAGDIISSELSKIGINVNFAPVVDLALNKNSWVIGPRSYSDNPFITTEMAKEFIRASLKYNVLPVIKHYPGHGSLEKDSHNKFLVNNYSYEELIKTELIPFLELSKNSEIGIMTAHIACPAIVKYIEKKEKKNYKNYYYLPATLSEIIVDKYLKKYNKSQALIFSDELSMKSITSLMPLEKASLKAIESGVNIIVINQNYDKIEKIANYILENYKKSKKFQEKVDKSVEKILQTKGMIFQTKLKLFSPYIFNLKKIQINRKDLNFINNESNRYKAYLLSLETTEIYRNRKNLIPLIKSKINFTNDFIVLSDNKNLYYSIKKWTSKVTFYRLKNFKIKNFNSKKAIIIYGIESQKDLEILKDVYRVNSNIIVINFLHKINVEKLDYIDTIICTYSNNILQIEAGVEILFKGKPKVKNKLLQEYTIF